MKILKQEDNPVLEYSKYIIEIEHNKEKTPTNQEVINNISKELKVNPELIKVKYIHSHFGLSKTKVIANIYKNLEMLKRLEEIKKKPKIKKEKKAKQGEKKG